MRTFESMAQGALKARTLEKRITLAQEAVEYALYHATGYYASPKLEHIYLEAASTIPEVACHPQKGTVLHVMTKAYASGGHTRVVQRWIELSKEKELHSIVLLKQDDEAIPEWLNEAAQKHGGALITFKDADDIAIANKLRQLASTYERIVLHVHPNDPVALIAFGTESFTTPIIYFNHADHLFWLGVSIADMVADMRYDHFSYIRRDVHQSYVLGIPCAPFVDNRVADKSAIRRELGIPENGQIIVTTGSAFKYRPLGNNCLSKQLVEIVRRNEKVSCYAIGPSMSLSEWKWANEVTNGKIHPLGVITNKDIYRKYLQAADMYMCSYPYGGYTSMMDAVQCGLPFLQLVMTRQQKSMLCLRPDIDQTKCLCYSTKELVNRTLAVLKDKKEYADLLASSIEWANDYVDQARWQERLYAMYSACSPRHAIHLFECQRGKQVYVDDEHCLMQLMYAMDDMEPRNKILRHIAHGWMRMKGV